MINKNELRYGNWVTCYGNTFQVGVIDETYIEWLGKDEGGFAYKDLQPIPLAPEILEKSGFKFGVNENGTYYVDLNGIDQQLEIVLSGDGFYPQLVQAPELSCEDCQVIPLNKIDAVHQLQNLYYALCGSELTINI
jgi:hypothetical protein